MNGEFDFIDRIRRQVKTSSPDLILGIGDDPAILREQSGRESLLTVDLLVEDVDFKLDYAVPRMLGHKALAVSLSDIAAMGGTPRFALLTLGIPPRLTASPAPLFWEEFFTGYFALAEKYGVTLIGGDLSATPERLTIDSIVMGHCRAGHAVRRGGARPGDAIYVTGKLGASTVGLKLLLAGQRVMEGEENLEQSALRAHLRPEPRVEFGGRLGESGIAHAMIDVSDGLAQDLAHICEESRVRAVIDRQRVPLSNCLSLLALSEDERFRLATGGGEDFELLFTAAEKDEAKLRELAEARAIPVTRIGEVYEHAEGPSIMLKDRGQASPLDVRGYEHFVN